MQAPICEKCLEGKKLCKDCQLLLESKKLSEADIRLARALHSLKQIHPAVKNIDVQKVLEAEGVTFIMVPHKQKAKLIGRKGKIADVLSTITNSRIRILVQDPQESLIKSVIYPMAFLGINKVYSPEGEFFKVRVPQADISRLPISQPSLEKILSNFLSQKTTIVAE